MTGVSLDYHLTARSGLEDLFSLDLTTSFAEEEGEKTLMG